MAGQNKTAMVAWLCARLVAVAGMVMVGIGLFTPMGAASFGWFAYQPLADATFVPGGSAVVLSRIAVVGWIVFAAGLVTLAFLAGRIAGRRSRD